MHKLIIIPALLALAACSPSESDNIISALTGGHDQVAEMHAAPFVSSPVVAPVEVVAEAAPVVVPVVVIEPPAPPVVAPQPCVPVFRVTYCDERDNAQ